MRLPDMRFTDRINKRMQLRFGGLDHTSGACDGALWDMRNLTGDHAPLLASRAPRWEYRTLSEGNGLYAWDKLCWVDGTDFYYGGAKKGTVIAGPKTFGCLAPYIVILPDKCWYNTDTGEFGSLEAKWTGVRLSFGNGTIGGVTAAANTITASGVSWAEYFRPGDAITIGGCTKHPENNKAPIIREIDGDKLIFSEYCFGLDGTEGDTEYEETGSLSISRTVPDLKFLCENENRLWGCTDNVIFCSKLGDVFNWNVMEGLDTDAWAVDTGSAGSMTGCVSFGGFPVFFKENYIYKIYGSVPSNFEVVGSATIGLAKGSEKSLAVAGDILFYLSRNGICAYSGGAPQVISSAFGLERFRDAVGGSDGLKYYVSMHTGKNDWRLCVYDTQRGVWHKEDETRVTHFAALNGGLYFLDDSGRIRIAGNCQEPPADAVQEDRFEWMAEFGDFTDSDPNKKGLSKLQLRLELDDGADVRVWLQFDSDGVWHQVSSIASEGTKRSCYLPIVPRRADHYRLKLEGSGGCRIHSLVREQYSGSELRNRQWRN